MHKALVLPALCLALASPAQAEGISFEYCDLEKCPRAAAEEGETAG